VIRDNRRIFAVVVIVLATLLIFSIVRDAHASGFGFNGVHVVPKLPGNGLNCFGGTHVTYCASGKKFGHGGDANTPILSQPKHCAAAKAEYRARHGYGTPKPLRGLSGCQKYLADQAYWSPYKGSLSVHPTVITKEQWASFGVVNPLSLF
jgi:hypothetical protein